MINYKFVNIEDDLKNTVSFLVKDICKENSINYQKQEYKILFSNEKILVKNNDIKFTSGANKSLSFYGKTYSNAKGKIVESIYLKDETVHLDTKPRSLLIMCNGVENSTKVDNDEDLLYFYVAPDSLLKLQDPSLWQIL